jgi:uncharacterized protein (TIGR03083 family)
MELHELAARWREFIGSATSSLERVHPDAWQRPTTYDGWTAHDLLAHLSSSQKALPRLVESAFTPPVAAAGAEPFDPDRWNASQIRRRRDQPGESLIDEFRQGSSELSIMMEHRVLPEDLARSVPAGAGRGRALGLTLEELLAHQRGHLSDLLQAVR